MARYVNPRVAGGYDATHVVGGGELRATVPVDNVVYVDEDEDEPRRRRAFRDKVSDRMLQRPLLVDVDPNVSEMDRQDFLRQHGGDDNPYPDERRRKQHLVGYGTRASAAFAFPSVPMGGGSANYSVMGGGSSAGGPSLGGDFAHLPFESRPAYVRRSLLEQGSHTGLARQGHGGPAAELPPAARELYPYIYPPEPYEADGEDGPDGRYRRLKDRRHTPLMSGYDHFRDHQRPYDPNTHAEYWVALEPPQYDPETGTMRLSEQIAYPPRNVMMHGQQWNTVENVRKQGIEPYFNGLVQYYDERLDKTRDGVVDKYTQWHRINQSPLLPSPPTDVGAGVGDAGGLSRLARATSKEGVEDAIQRGIDHTTGFHHMNGVITVPPVGATAYDANYDVQRSSAAVGGNVGGAPAGLPVRPPKPPGYGQLDTWASRQRAAGLPTSAATHGGGSPMPALPSSPSSSSSASTVSTSLRVLMTDPQTAIVAISNRREAQELPADEKNAKHAAIVQLHGGAPSTAKQAMGGQAAFAAQYAAAEAEKERRAQMLAQLQRETEEAGSDPSRLKHPYSDPDLNAQLPRAWEGMAPYGDASVGYYNEDTDPTVPERAERARQWHADRGDVDGDVTRAGEAPTDRPSRPDGRVSARVLVQSPPAAAASGVTVTLSATERAAGFRRTPLDLVHDGPSRRSDRPALFTPSGYKRRDDDLMRRDERDVTRPRYHNANGQRQRHFDARVTGSLNRQLRRVDLDPRRPFIPSRTNGFDPARLLVPQRQRTWAGSRARVPEDYPFFAHPGVRLDVQRRELLVAPTQHERRWDPAGSSSVWPRPPETAAAHGRLKNGVWGHEYYDGRLDKGRDTTAAFPADGVDDGTGHDVVDKELRR